MRLQPDLEAEFLRYEGAKEDGHVHWTRVETLAEAHGVRFLCPLCFATNQGNVGTHSVICWFEGKVPDEATPGPGRWNPQGTGLNDLTFVPGAKTQSVKLEGGCNWHGFVVNGDAA